MSKDPTIRAVSTAALECRDVRCAWSRDRRHDQREPMWGIRRWDSCDRCGNWRSAIECSDGRVDPATRDYEYSAAYEKALQFTREDARRELNRRARARATRPRRTVVVERAAQRPALRAVS